MEDGAETTGNRIHLKSAPPEGVQTFILPDGWIENELDAVDLPHDAAEISDHEWPDSDQVPTAPNVEAAAPATAAEPHPPEEPALRRSTRMRKAKTCHSCPGCHLIQNFLNTVDNFHISEEKLPQILRWALS